MGRPWLRRLACTLQVAAEDWDAARGAGISFQHAIKPEELGNTLLAVGSATFLRRIS